MSENIVVKVDKVYKNFLLPNEKNDSLKRVFTGVFRKKKKGYEVQRALHDISFEVKEGEFFGIVGRNGSGKSTLLKMLASIYQPTKGSITTNGRLVPFIELGVGFNPELTGRENIFLNGALLGFKKSVIESRYDEIVRFSELERFMDQKLKNYSSGMQVRLAFAIATHAQADILLVDEVLAVGDAAFQRKCFEYFKELKAKKKTVIFVTHDMSAVREYCDRAMLIDNSELQAIGDPQDIARDYALLFMENNVDRNNDSNGKRWGNGDAEITESSAVVEGDEVVIDVKAVVKRPIDHLLYGVHVSSQDGTEITAMNNRMLLVDDVNHLKPGDEVTIRWRVLNVFNDGSYSVTLTLADDVANTLDWMTDATIFTVRRMQRSTTSVLPPVKVKAKKVTKES